MSNKDAKKRNSKETTFNKGESGNMRSDGESSVSLTQITSNESTPAEPLVVCSRDGCINAAIVHPDWDGDFCSKDCALMRCREVFLQWVTSQKSG